MRALGMVSQSRQAVGVGDIGYVARVGVIKGGNVCRAGRGVYNVRILADS
jgi:hypothetical protein